MPLDLTSGATLASDTVFQRRVALAFYFVARQVMTEADSVEGHEVRERYARSIILSEFTEFQKLSAVVATDPTIVQNANPMTGQTSVTDTQIIAAVAAAWSRLAGVGRQ